MDTPIPETVNPAENPLSTPNSAPNFLKKNFIIIIPAILAVLLIIIVTVVLLLPKNNKAIEQRPRENALNNQPQQTKASSQPKLKFESYILKNKQDLTPTVGDSTTYNLKTNFTEQDVSGIAVKFGLSKISSKGNNFLAEDSTDPSAINSFSLNKITGEIYAKFGGNQKSADYIPGQSAQASALQIINQLGLSYPIINCPVTYQASDQPEITYVECHRNWGAIGPQLVNYIAVMSLPLDLKIGSFIPGNIAPNTPTDTKIINVSNGDNNKARPNGYNTVTIGVRPDGRIASINSNLRWVETPNKVIPSSELITEAQAISIAQNGKTPLEISYSNSNVELSKIYPGNVGSAKMAIIDEILPVYLDYATDKKQTSYTPYYLIRGTANLDSGYAIKYEQILPAEKSKYNSSDIPSPELAQAEIMSSDSKQIQLGAITPTLTAVPFVETTVPPPSTNLLCTQADIDSEKNNIAHDQEGASYYGPYNVNVPGYGRVRLGWNYVRGGIYMENLVNGKEIDIRKVHTAAADQIGGVFLTGGPVPNNSGRTCEVRFIAAVTPELFFYPKVTTEITIDLLSPVVFTKPLAINSQWKIKAEPNGDLIGSNFIKRSYLYYEYDSGQTSFTQPRQGFIVNLNNIEALVSEISNRLDLNDKETNRLILDVKKTVDRFDSSYIRVGLLDQTTIEKQLPLIISPKPSTLHRVNLILSETDAKQTLRAPKIDPIIRSGYTVIEVGVSVE